MKRENCPFCGHRWIRRSDEKMVTCPNCKEQYDSEEIRRLREEMEK